MILLPVAVPLLLLLLVLLLVVFVVLVACAAAVAWLVSPAASYVTGSEIFVTGGQHLF